MSACGPSGLQEYIKPLDSGKSRGNLRAWNRDKVLHDRSTNLDLTKPQYHGIRTFISCHSSILIIIIFIVLGHLSSIIRFDINIVLVNLNYYDEWISSFNCNTARCHNRNITIVATVFLTYANFFHTY